MTIKAVSFDADQTLWNFDAVLAKALHATINEMSRLYDIQPGSVTVEQLKQTRHEVLKNYQDRPYSLEEVREHSFRLVLERIGRRDPATEAKQLVDVFFRVRFQEIQLYPEVAAILQRLQSQWKLALLTNGNTYPDSCGLPNIFEAVVMAPAYGIFKPDPRIFEILAVELGVPTAELVHIGDHADDIDGANAVGATSILIDRTNSAQAGLKMRANHVVSDLTKLDKLLAEL